MEQNLTKVNIAYKVDVQLKEIKRVVNSNFLMIAEKLKSIKDNKYYKVLGYDTFESYIAQPELAFSRSSVYRLIQIYKKFVLENNVAPERLSEIEWTKLAVVTPHVNKDNMENLLHDAKELSRSDLKQKIKDPVRLKVERKYITCPKCGYQIEL